LVKTGVDLNGTGEKKVLLKLDAGQKITRPTEHGGKKKKERFFVMNQVDVL